MKDFKNDSTSVLARFGRDKRQRTVTATAERVERRPRLQRDAADSEQPSDDRKPDKRASYNPHFTEDNRPAFDRPRRSFGDKPQGDRARSDERYRDGDKPRRSFGDKPRGDKPAYGDSRGPKKFGAPATANSGIKNPVTAASATNPINPDSGSTTTNRLPIRNSPPKSRSAKCA